MHFWIEGTTNKRYARSSSRTSPSVQNHLDIVQENTSIGRIRLMIGAEENVIVENSQLYSKKITATAGVQGNLYKTLGTNDVIIQRNDVNKIEVYDTRIHINDEFRVYKTSDSSKF